MSAALSRAIMALAACCMDERRREWTAAMQGEFEAAVDEGKPMRFALGCLAAALRELPASETGRFSLTNYGLALGLMLPMAAFQIGCALLGLPYLYPGGQGLPGALLIGNAHEPLVRGIYQAAIPSLALLLLILGVGHLAIAWAMLERQWARVTRTATFLLAAAASLIIVMSVLFIDCTQAVIQTGVLAIELATLTIVARWHAQLFPEPLTDPPG